MRSFTTSILASAALTSLSLLATPSLAQLDAAATCSLAADSGPCRAAIPSWAFNANTGTCQQFIYGGCKGNTNRFATLEECQAACYAAAGVCSQPTDPGICEASMPSWAFDGGACVEFAYGGCGGNGNRFATESACIAACSSGNSPGVAGNTHAQAGGTNPVLTDPYMHDPDAAARGGLTDDAGLRVLAAVPSSSSAGDDQGDSDTCMLPLDPGSCEAAIWTWGFQGGKCVPWQYGGCEGNGNRFDSFEECDESCGRSLAGDICHLPELEEGVEVVCRAYIPMWRFNSTAGQCEEFVYGGCGGTANQFGSQESCVEMCGGKEAAVSGAAGRVSSWTSRTALWLWALGAVAAVTFCV